MLALELYGASGQAQKVGKVKEVLRTASSNSILLEEGLDRLTRLRFAWPAVVLKLGRPGQAPTSPFGAGN